MDNSNFQITSTASGFQGIPKNHETTQTNIVRALPPLVEPGVSAEEAVQKVEEGRL